MPAYHSKFTDVTMIVGNMAILPIRSNVKGPAPRIDDGEDIIDEALAYFKPNIFFREFEIKGAADRTLIYLTLYISECLRKLQKSSNRSQAVKDLSVLALSHHLPIPGEANFPLNSMYKAPANRNEEDVMRSYLLQLRQELGARLIEHVFEANNERPNKGFYDAARKYKKLRARFDQRQKLKNEYELLIKFDEHTYELFGLYQQAIIGDINVPKMNYRDPNEMSYMWSWIKGNRKWHAWNKCKDDAMCLYVERVNELEKELDRLIDDWKDELDPRVPDKNAWVPEEEAEEFRKVMEQAKRERRERDALKRQQESEDGMWDE